MLAALVAAAPLPARERNGWPLWVEQTDPAGTVQSGEYLGPLFFRKTQTDGSQVEGARPFFLHTVAGQKETNLLFYPLFTWQREGDWRNFSFFQLVNIQRETDADRRTTRNFDVWPFYFSRDNGEPADSYRALFPFGGTIKQRLGYDRIHFVLFPLYADLEQKGRHTTHAPWPFLRFINGGGAHGFEFWPLFGHQGRAGDYDSQFYLWPLIYKSVDNLSEAQPEVKLGVLPFYARKTAPDYIDETYVWPFFGYTHRTAPVKYDERRYLWPFLVQGRGDVSYINRWAPVFTHSVIKGYDKTWIVWPFYRHARWADGGIAQEQNQVFFFVYWSLTQRSTTHPAAAPAHKTHLWPLLSSWDNGAGCRQVQLLSPFEVFFPTNEPIRQLYTPLVALYRYDQSAPDSIRQSALFNLVSWKKSPFEKEFHLGPLIHTYSTPQQSRVSLGLGLLNWSRAPGASRWRLSLFDFSSRKIPKAVAAQSP